MIRHFSSWFFICLVLLLGAIAHAQPYSDRLYEGERLYKGQWLKSSNGQYQLIMQSDGNLVLYGRGRALWASNTNGQAVNNCIMQNDGNLVIYGYPNAIWASNTDQNPGAYLTVQDDGNVVIYIARKAIWATGTN